MGNSVSGLSIESVSGVYSKYSNTTVDTESSSSTSYLDFDSYLKILAAQMSNQDFNDPMSDSEMLQQMASYSMLEGIQNMTSQSNISYATSLVGKAVTVNDGDSYDTGIVESVVVSDSTPYLIVNGSQYKIDTVSNITTSDIYNKLSSLIGYTVDAKTVDSTGASTTTTGEVTNVLMLDGEAYVVLDGKTLYSLSDISLRSNSSEDDSEGGDDAEDGSSSGTGIDGSTAVSADTSESGSETTTVSSVSESAAMASSSYIAQSQALFDELMSTIDSISGNTTETETEVSVIPNLSGYEEVTIDYVETPDYAAAFLASSDEYLQSLSAYDDIDTVSASAVDMSNTSVSTYDSNSYSQSSSSASTGTTTLRSGLYDQTLTTSNLYQTAASSYTGTVSSILSNDEAYSILASGDYNTRYSTRYGLEVQSDTKPGISISDCEPHRYNADQYPAEAALADSLGTRMYDVKYISNTAITSRIDTSTVIGKTLSGKEITEIGYSGVGKLGEVVTFKDGTQRVEILFNNGDSGWLTTSGNYTLDEICDFNCEPGSLSGKLTPAEAAIRNYSRELTSTEQASATALKQQLISMGVSVTES